MEQLHALILTVDHLALFVVVPIYIAPCFPSIRRDDLQYYSTAISINQYTALLSCQTIASFMSHPWNPMRIDRTAARNRYRHCSTAGESRRGRFGFKRSSPTEAYLGSINSNAVGAETREYRGLRKDEVIIM